MRVQKALGALHNLQQPVSDYWKSWREHCAEKKAYFEQGQIYDRLQVLGIIRQICVLHQQVSVGDLLLMGHISQGISSNWLRTLRWPKWVFHILVFDANILYLSQVARRVLVNRRFARFSIVASLLILQVHFFVDLVRSLAFRGALCVNLRIRPCLQFMAEFHKRVSCRRWKSYSEFLCLAYQEIACLHPPSACARTHTQEKIKDRKDKKSKDKEK